MITVFGLWLTLGTAPAQANFVSYIDEKGTRHIVSSVEEIPEQYREHAKESRAGDSSNSRNGGPMVSGGKKPASSGGRGGGRGRRKGASSSGASEE